MKNFNPPIRVHRLIGGSIVNTNQPIITQEAESIWIQLVGQTRTLYVKHKKQLASKHRQNSLANVECIFFKKYWPRAASERFLNSTFKQS